MSTSRSFVAVHAERLLYSLFIVGTELTSLLYDVKDIDTELDGLEGLQCCYRVPYLRLRRAYLAVASGPSIASAVQWTTSTAG